MKKKRICLFHPWLKSKGGAEAVVLAFLKNTTYDVDVYTWTYDAEKTFPEFKNYKINVIAPSFMKSLSRLFLLRSLLLLFSKIPLEDYEYLFISTSGVAEIILLRNKSKPIIAYCHTVLRAAYPEDVRWNLDNKYSNPLKKLVYLIAVFFYNKFERISWKKINTVIFNSELSMQRGERKGLIEGKSTHVVYPPVKLREFSNLKVTNGNYFLYVSRFNLPKRQHVLIKAWKKFQKAHPNEQLLLAGSTENKSYYKVLEKEIQGLNITLCPNLPNKELFNLYAHCKALLFVPFVEDFGIVPLEGISLNKPIIAVDRGGYMKFLKDYKLYFPIIERGDDFLMVDEIYNSLEAFINTKSKKAKKYKLQNLDEKSFVARIDKIIKEVGK